MSPVSPARAAAAFTMRQASSLVIGRPLRVRNTCTARAEPGSRTRPSDIQASSAFRALGPPARTGRGFQQALHLLDRERVREGLPEARRGDQGGGVAGDPALHREV